MSYKFDIRRCVECGAVWFDPKEIENFDGDGTHPRETCGIVYESPNGIQSACDGRVVGFALVDADMFVCIHKDAFG